jgi:hypothetical protein
MIAILARNKINAQNFMVNLTQDAKHLGSREGRFLVNDIRFQYINREDNLMSIEISGFIILDGFWTREDANDIFQLATTRIRAAETP